MIGFNDWKSGLSAASSDQHLCTNLTTSSSHASSVIEGLNGGFSPILTFSTISVD